MNMPELSTNLQEVSYNTNPINSHLHLFNNYPLVSVWSHASRPAQTWDVWPPHWVRQSVGEEIQPMTTLHDRRRQAESW